MRSGKPQLTLSTRDAAILDHVYRFRLSTSEFLQRLFFADVTRFAVSNVIARLVTVDYLRECTLEPGFRYLVLGRRGARHFDIDGRSCRRFTEQSLPLAYGLAAYCLTRGLHKLTGREFRAAFSELARTHSNEGFYFRANIDGDYRLGMPLLDRGTSPKSLLRRVDRLLQQRLVQPAFARFIHDRRFSITILTAWPQKQRYLSAAVSMTVRGPVHVAVECVPELQRLLPGP